MPHGAAPSLDGTAGGTPGEPHFTSPNLNPDGDWIRLEDKTADGYSFSIFLNRFRFRRAPSRDETVRKEVRRTNRRTREVGGGMCVTEEDVTYETRLRRAYILDQAYDYYIVDGWLEWWYGIFNHDGSTLGSMVAGTAGVELAGGLTAGSGIVAGGAATVGMTIGGALLVGGATFVSMTQGMSEWKEASKKHHSGWLPIMWYFERDSLPDDPDPLTVTELVAMHPCGRPVTGSPEPTGTGFVFSATPVVDGVDPSAAPDDAEAEQEDELPGLPTEEGDVEATPDAEMAADQVPETDVPLMSKPEFDGSGENRSSPDFAPENDWYRDLGERGGYHFVVQYVNRYREVADNRFDSRSEEAIPTSNEPRTRRNENGLCQDEVEHDISTYAQTGTRVDQQFQIWRVDSAEAAEKLKKALREKASGESYTTPSGIGSNTASTASGHVATSAEITGGLLDFPGGVANAASETAGSVAGVVGSVAGWAGNIIDILGLEEPPVPAGAGWTPVGYYLNGAEMDGEDARRDWLPVGDPYVCPDEGTGDDAAAASVPPRKTQDQPTGSIPAEGVAARRSSPPLLEGAADEPMTAGEKHVLALHLGFDFPDAKWIPNEPPSEDAVPEQPDDAAGDPQPSGGDPDHADEQSLEHDPAAKPLMGEVSDEVSTGSGAEVRDDHVLAEDTPKPDLLTEPTDDAEKTAWHPGALMGERLLEDMAEFRAHLDAGPDLAEVTAPTGERWAAPGAADTGRGAAQWDPVELQPSGDTPDSAPGGVSTKKLIQVAVGVFGATAVALGGYVFATGGDDDQIAGGPADTGQISTDEINSGDQLPAAGENNLATPAFTPLGGPLVPFELPGPDGGVSSIALESFSGVVPPLGDALPGNDAMSGIGFSADQTTLSFELRFEPPPDPFFVSLTFANDGRVALEASAVDGGAGTQQGVSFFADSDEGPAADGSIPRFVLPGSDVQIADGLLVFELPRVLRVPGGLPINRGGELDVFLTVGASGESGPLITRYPAGQVLLPPDWLFEDGSLQVIPFEAVRRQGLAGAPQAVADCIVETVPFEAEVLGLLEGTLGDLFVPCYFSASPVGDMAATGLAGFGPDERETISCIGNQLGLRAVSIEDVAALALPWEEWPPGLLETYAAALEVCVPLEPFYIARFSAFDYTRGGCPEAMTGYVLDRYSWQRFIVEGIIDTDQAVRDAARARFEGDVNAGYILLQCFQA